MVQRRRGEPRPVHAEPETLASRRERALPAVGRRCGRPPQAPRSISARADRRGGCAHRRDRASVECAAHLVPRPRARAGAPVDARAALGSSAALPPRLADCREGQRRGRGRALHDGVDDLRRAHFVGVRHRGAASGGVRGARHREVEHSGVCGGRKHIQRGLRRHTQSVEHAVHAGRLIRRNGGGSRGRPGVARHRKRFRRQHPASFQLLFAGGPAAHGGSGAAHPAAAVFRAQRRGPDDAQRRGLRADAGMRGRASSARPVVGAGGAWLVHACGGQSAQARQGGLQPRSGRGSGRPPGSRAPVHRCGQEAGKRWLPGGDGLPGSLRCGADLSDTARRCLRRQHGAAAGQAPPCAQAGRDRECRVRLQAHQCGHRAGGNRPRGDRSPHGQVLRAIRCLDLPGGALSPRSSSAPSMPCRASSSRAIWVGW